MTYRWIIIISIISTLLGCSQKTTSVDDTIFSALEHSISGINFENTLIETDSLNYFTYSYIYMGAGVATGDINNDGLIDIFFTGNQVQNKLYLNKGNLQFEDISDVAGISGDNRWYTGVTMADVNGDGFLDIYCSVGGKSGVKNNQLFVNNGNNTFTEKAASYKIDDIGNSVQGTFFDYDKDGDLDLYVANYPPTVFTAPNFYYQYKMANTKDHESDHLFRNDGDVFTDVTEEAMVKSFGLSLSATVGDLNNDSWPDIYVSNDFSTPDYFYINNQDGTFREVVKEATAHTAFFGMGVDIADYNNDGNLDIFQVDMDAESNRRKKANMASMNPKLFWSTVNAGFHYQYMHNCMQLNTGVMKNGVPHFSNISRITGTSSTDWSWGPLFADFDNDGRKDLFISNGTRREINNNDYFNDLIKVKDIKDSLLQRSQMIPSEKIDNYIFKNTGDHSFEKANKKWGIEYEGFSNGVAYADLDNDGDLEIVTNNIDDFASVFENKSSQRNNYIKVRFEGRPQNPFGIGNRVYIKTGDELQMQELTLTRGFQSSVAPELHFGIGNFQSVKELKVIWTDGKTQIIKDIKANQNLTINYSEANVLKSTEDDKVATVFDSNFDNDLMIFRHKENVYDDFSKQVLLPHRMSAFGPALAVGDLNNDGLSDYFVGGACGYSGVLFFQTPSGFEKVETDVFDNDKISEDVGAMIFDADQDGDNDLYIVSGGYEFSTESDYLQDRLYINDGNGSFKKSTTSLPKMLISGSRSYHLDFDKDGKQDILVLGRQVPGRYPNPTSSYLLRNISEDGNPRFEDVTYKIAPEFMNMGMATDAVVTDFDNDGWMDIIIVGEWMPIRVFKNNKNTFEEVSELMGLTQDTTGWWWNIEQGDFDQDGDMDYVVGNNGLNYKYKATEEETFDIYVSDFDKDNKDDIVLSYYNDGKQFPVRGRECSSQQISAIKKKFKDYESFSEATLIDVYTEKSLESSLHYQVKSFASVYIENQGDKFVIRKLPREAQISSINKSVIRDFDKDGYLDILMAGNLYASEVETPRNDAGYGMFLKGDGKGNFESITSSNSGLFVKGDVKDMEPIKVNGMEYILIAKNNDDIQWVRVNTDSIRKKGS